MKNWGIRTRVLLLALLPAVLISVMLSGYMVFRMSADAERELRTYGNGLLRQLAAVAEFAAYAGDEEALHKIALAALDETHILAVVIYDVYGIALTGSAMLSARLSPLPPVGQPTLLDHDESSLLLAAPITFHPLAAADALLAEPGKLARPALETLGWITLRLSRTAMQQRKGEALFIALFSTFALLVLAGVLAMLLARQVTRPILRLQDAVARMQAGHLEAPVLLADSGGDLQRLEEGLNAMAEALRENRALLQMKIALATHALQEKKDEAEQANIAKSRFLAAASHDLRQPLHALSLFAADLGREQLSPPQQRLSRQINASVSSIAGLLDALLDISRLDLSEVAPQKTVFSLDKVFAKMDNIFSRLAQDKGLRFHYQSSPLQVFSDRGLLERLLGNLLANATAYTAHGGILIAARQQGASVCIEVRDSGIGIAPEHQQAVFQEFFQVGNAGRVQGQGLGLGLAIVLRLARLLETRVDLRSALGKGSVFSLLLPLAPSPAGTPLPVLLRAAPIAAPPTLCLALCRPPTPALEEVAALAARWGMASSWIEPLNMLPVGAGHEQIIVFELFERFEPSLLAHATLGGARLILLGHTGKDRPEGTHTLPLPLRPAKLRALLNALYFPEA